MAELENVEVNRQLCSVDIFSWSPETQEQVLAEWDDWQREEAVAEKPGNCCVECGHGKVFARPDSLKRHMKRVHTSEAEATVFRTGIIIV